MGKRTSLILANYLRDERMLMDFRRLDVHEATKIATETLNAYENDRRFPARSESDRLAKVFNQDADQFYSFVVLNKVAKEFIDNFEIEDQETIQSIVTIFGAILHERMKEKMEGKRARIKRVFVDRDR